MRRRLTVLVFAAAIASVGCSTPDYGEMRRTRNARPYLGGAAAVPGSIAPEARPSSPSAVEGLGFVAAIAAMISSNVDHTHDRLSDYPDPRLDHRDSPLVR